MKRAALLVLTLALLLPLGVFLGEAPATAQTCQQICQQTAFQCQQSCQGQGLWCREACNQDYHVCIAACP